MTPTTSTTSSGFVLSNQIGQGKLLSIEEGEKKHAVELHVDTPVKKSQIEEAAVIFQKFFRGKLARKNFHIEQESEKFLYDFPGMVFGNDPYIEKLYSHQAKDGNIVLIATSCLRAVEIACKLGNPNRDKFLPKIILIDHAIKVSLFWNAIRKFAKENTKQEDFLNNLEQFLIDHSKLITTTSYMLGYNMFLRFFENYGFDYVRKVIINTAYIRQGWQNSDTFNSLRNIIQHHKIQNVYVYASNIVPCTADFAQKILKNIQLLKPKLSIHSNYDFEKRGADEIHLFEDSEPGNIIKKLFPEGLETFKNKKEKITTPNRISYKRKFE